MSKKQVKSQIEIDADAYLSRLTDLEIETPSRVMLALCESVRDVDLYISEKNLLESFIEWATVEVEKLSKEIGTESETGDIDPNQGEMFP